MILIELIGQLKIQIIY